MNRQQTLAHGERRRIALPNELMYMITELLDPYHSDIENWFDRRSIVDFIPGDLPHPVSGSLLSLARANTQTFEIARPFFYRTLRIRSAAELSNVYDKLSSDPASRPFVKAIFFMADIPTFQATLLVGVTVRLSTLLLIYPTGVIVPLFEAIASCTALKRLWVNLIVPPSEGSRILRLQSLRLEWAVIRITLKGHDVSTSYETGTVFPVHDLLCGATKDTLRFLQLEDTRNGLESRAHPAEFDQYRLGPRQYRDAPIAFASLETMHINGGFPARLWLTNRAGFFPKLRTLSCSGHMAVLRAGIQFETLGQLEHLSLRSHGGLHRYPLTPGLHHLRELILHVHGHRDLDDLCNALKSKSFRCLHTLFVQVYRLSNEPFDQTHMASLFTGLCCLRFLTMNVFPPPLIGSSDEEKYLSVFAGACRHRHKK